MITDALKNLRPGAQWVLDGNDIEWIVNENTGDITASNLLWFSEDMSIPSKQEIDEELVRMTSEIAATEYQRLRQPEYPPLADLADALYWQSKGDETKIAAYLAAVEAVKQKYPKV